MDELKGGWIGSLLVFSVLALLKGPCDRGPDESRDFQGAHQSGSSCRKRTREGLFVGWAYRDAPVRSIGRVRPLTLALGLQ